MGSPLSKLSFHGSFLKQGVFPVACLPTTYSISFTMPEPSPLTHSPLLLVN